MFKIPLKESHHQAFRWRADECGLGSFVIFQGVQTNNAKKL